MFAGLVRCADCGSALNVSYAKVEEKRGRPLLPPVGLDTDDLDWIQQEIFQYCNEIIPRYIPRIEIEEYDGKNVIYLWSPAGDGGPYTAPIDVLSKSKKEKHGVYWIKPGSVKTIAKGDEISELFEKFNSVPFDDRVNRKATINDLAYGYIEEFIRKSDSALLDVKKGMQMEDLLLALEVANETDVGIDIRNIGILMFGERPDKLISGAQIDIVHFHTSDREGGDFTETILQGPIQEQVRKALDYIGSTVVTEKVVKHDDRPEADRFFTYPLSSIEEALVNSIFHKSYRIPEPVEVRIYIDEIKILNYPGPDKSIDMDKFSAGLAIPRRYRNRRIGEFLKEIDLSEKRSTGITKILKALAVNGSPLPEFETNADREYLITTFKVHEGFEMNEIPGFTSASLSSDMSTQNTTPNVRVNVSNVRVNVSNVRVNATEQALLNAIAEKTFVNTETFAKTLGISERTVYRNIASLKEKGILTRHGSDKGGYWKITE